MSETREVSLDTLAEMVVEIGSLHETLEANARLIAGLDAKIAGLERENARLRVPQCVACFTAAAERADKLADEEHVARICMEYWP